jgi:NAD+ kinase
MNSRIAIFGKSFDNSIIPYIQEMFNAFNGYGWQCCVYEPYLTYLKARIALPEGITTFNRSQYNQLEGSAFFLSIGGDGTFLETVTFASGAGIPVLGINTGRLGFLSNVASEEIPRALEALHFGHYRTEERALLEALTDDQLFGKWNFALNELTIHKKDSSSMITIHTYVDDHYLNSYWADGLIISTPTGSTAYSLSCGGPILVPQARNFIITPIAPHNLNVRPVVLPDDVTIRLQVEGRSENFLASLDSRSETIGSSQQIIVRRKTTGIHLVQLEHQNFFNTIRNKMMWGIDRRN